MNLCDVINALEDVRYHLTSQTHKNAIDNAVALLHRQNYEIERLLIENEKAIQEGLSLPDRLEIDSKARTETVKEYEAKLLDELEKTEIYSAKNVFDKSSICVYLAEDARNAIYKASKRMVGANNGNTEKDN